MSLPQLIILAIAAMAGLAALRVVRFRAGKSPLPDGRGRRLFLFAFVVAPPLTVALLTRPTADGQLAPVSVVPLYVVILTALVGLMWIASLIVSVVMPGRSGKLIRFALVGNAGDPYAPHADPPVTPKLGESIAVVATANLAFPRGRAFPTEIARSGFRADWDVLETATRELEGRIADDHRIGLDVAAAATNTAADARSRLDTLKNLALDQGQAWAVA
jgi:hypothetical protein